MKHSLIYYIPVQKGISFEIAVVDETGETVVTETVYLGQDLSDNDFESLVLEKEGYTVEIVSDVVSLAVASKKRA